MLQRSLLESGEGRSVERSMLQVQAIVDSLYKDEKKSHVRLFFVYASGLPPFWEVERALCQLLQSLGSTKSALDVALRIKSWEDVIACYHQLQLRHKAAEIIKEEIERKGETPLLLCMLGDATDDLANYHRALEISGGKSARAHRYT